MKIKKNKIKKMYKLNYGNTSNLTESDDIEDIPHFFLNFQKGERIFASFNFRGKVFFI